MKKSVPQSAFFNLRVLIALFIVLAGVFLALLGFGTFSSAQANAANQPGGQNSQQQQFGNVTVLPRVSQRSVTPAARIASGMAASRKNGSRPRSESQPENTTQTSRCSRSSHSKQLPRSFDNRAVHPRPDPHLGRHSFPRRALPLRAARYQWRRGAHSICANGEWGRSGL